ncbi:MAG: hypothetical protein C0478_09660 [Planctomyces sp.]|nr:hypothetical protein [Planctomyces sp.]
MPHRNTTTRSGVTLSEVLISLMIMGIGIVGLASLFPVSVLKSVAATNMTNSAVLSYNVRGLRSSLSQVATGAPIWQPGLTVTAGPARPTYLIPAIADERVMFPRVVFRCSTGGTTGRYEPTWRTGTGIYADGNGDSTPDDPADATQWASLSLANGYVVDPLGSFRMQDAFSSATAANFFGNDGTNPLNTIPRFAGSATTLLQATQLATLPDSWLLQIESKADNFPVAVNGDNSFTIAFPDQTGLDQIVNPALTTSRLVMFDADLREVIVRQIAATPAPTSTELSYIGALPSGFLPTVIRIETQELRYTWLTTTRVKTDGTRNSDAAIFFRRQFGPNDERLHGAYVGAYVDGSGAAASVIVVKYDVNDPPKWKKGGYVLDAGRMRWYRIAELQTDFASLAAAKPTDFPGAAFYPTALTTGTGATYARIRIEGRVSENSNDGQVIVMPNIVDVFPLNPLSIRDIQ